MSAQTLASLRDLVPLRPLSPVEAFSVAEQQALRLTGAGRSPMDGPVDDRLVGDLGFVRVLRGSTATAQAGSTWERGKWTILLNANDAPARQRFSLAHELKHILDYRFFKLIYAGIPADYIDQWREDVANYFAACVLMPRPWVKHAWGNGVQCVDLLADQFAVSQIAMRIRLVQLGLVDPQPRHAPFQTISSARRTRPRR